MPTFVVNHEGTEKTLECQETETVQNLKDTIVKEFSIEDGFTVDIDFKLDKPIRSLGKFNLEPGILPRTLDRYTWDRFELSGKTIHLMFHKIKQYTNMIVKKPLSGKSGAYRPPSFESGEVVSAPSFNLESDSDFPPLGS